LACAVTAREDFFFNGFRLQSFIANFPQQSKCWRSRTLAANLVIGSDAFKFKRASLGTSG
jgi:hypothetical protein